MVPRLPGGPDPTRPVPLDPVEGIDLRGCARIVAALAAGGRPRAAILAQQRLDDARWAHVEKTWMLRLATAMLAGDLEPAHTYDALLVEAQDALTAGEVALEMDAYAAITARLEAGRDPVGALRKAGLTALSYARAQRAWTQKVAADPDLSRELRRRVDAERARLDQPP